MKRNNIFELTLTSTFVVIILLMSLIPQIGFVTILPGVSITLVHIPTLIAVFILRPKSGLIVSVMFGIGSLIASFMYAATPFDIAFRNPLVSVLPRALFGIAAWGVFQGFLRLSKIRIGKYLMFGFVTLITTFAVFYGTVQISKNVVWNEYNTYISSEVVDPVVQEQLFEEASATESQVLPYIYPVALVVIVIFISVYYYFVSKENYSDLVVSSSFILGTIIHTVLVLTAVILFASEFKMAFGDAVNLIYGIAITNGLIEALVAVVIGVPIYTALKKLPAFENYKLNTK